MKRILAAAVFIQWGAQAAFAQTALNTLTAQEEKEGFRLLFDGTLNSFKTNWVDYIKGNTTNTNLSSEWTINAANQYVGIQNTTEDVRSKVMYKDFDFRMDYRCDGNEGVYYRSLVTTDRAWQSGIEFAIEDASSQTKVAPGSAYDLYPPVPPTYQLFSTGKWNSMRIVAKADSIEHWLNGVKVVGFKLHSPAFWTAFTASKWNADKRLTFKVPGNQAGGYIDQGYFGLQASHGGRWQIRNIKISENPCMGAPDAADRVTRCGFGPSGVIGRETAGPGPGADAGATLLRRAAGGLSLALSATDVLGAEIVSLDGRVWRGSVSQGEARFAGSFRSGVYLIRLRTVGGEFTRKASL